MGLSDCLDITCRAAGAAVGGCVVDGIELSIPTLDFVSDESGCRCRFRQV